jgi:hypothetical protein
LALQRTAAFFQIATSRNCTRCRVKPEKGKITEKEKKKNHGLTQNNSGTLFLLKSK